MIVVDSNVLAYLYLPGEFTEEAERLLEADPEWHTPILWRSKFRIILAGYLRRGDLGFDQAYALQREAEESLSGGEHEADSKQVLELLTASDCSACDCCEFMAVAETLGANLVTLDAKLLRAFPGTAKSPCAG